MKIKNASSQCSAKKFLFEGVAVESFFIELFVLFTCGLLYGYFVSAANTVVELNLLRKLYHLFLEWQIVTVELAPASLIEAM